MQLKLHIVTIEDLIPKGHFLRKLEATLDLSFIREKTAHLYNHRYGRPAIDPVVLVKYLLVGYLYGIPSERQIEQRIQTDVALRWYLGLDLFDRVPDHSTVPYLEHLEQIHRDVLPIQAATADAAYDFPLAHRVLEEQGISFYVRPQPSADRTKAEFKRDAFSYNEEKDVDHCPNGKELRVKGLYRSASGVYWEYWADRGDCRSCPFREKCLSGKDKRGARRLLDTYFRPTVRRHLARQNEPDYLDALRKRQIWCEGTFATQKWGHNLTRVLRRGLEAAEDHCLLSATALNLKRMIKCIE